METELAKKEQFLQLVLNNIPSYVFWKDRNSNYLGCNMNFAISAGLNSPEEIIGKSDYDLPWSKEESDFYRKTDKEVMDSGESQINFEEPQTASDGSAKWLRTNKIPLLNEEKEVIGILGSYEDITRRKSLELELLAKNKNLQKINQKLEMINIDLEQFAYATSHDLQEPLRMIGGFTGLIEKKYEAALDEQGKEYLGYIKKGAKRMSSLIEQILFYSKLDKVEEKLELVDLNDLVAKIVDELGLSIRDKEVLFQIDLPSKKLYCQAARMEMLFNNLIRNGIKFNESENPSIEIKFKEKEKEWYFTVSDNGIGIKEEYQDYIFKPFKRLENRLEFPGNGIGLSICKRIINLHKGKIWFTSNSIQGTTFHFTISKTIEMT